jgi:hypothetical protein
MKNSPYRTPSPPHLDAKKRLSWLNRTILSSSGRKVLAVLWMIAVSIGSMIACYGVGHISSYWIHEDNGGPPPVVAKFLIGFMFFAMLFLVIILGDTFLKPSLRFINRFLPSLPKDDK